MLDSRLVDGYEIFGNGSHTVIIRPEWKSWILEDLETDFRLVGLARRRTYGHGRVQHFSYLPEGASGRVFVRRVARGGLLGALLGGLHLGMGRPLGELAATEAALRAGVAVPEPVAVRATRVTGPLRRFTVVTREIEDASNLLSLAPNLAPADKRRIIGRVADEMRRLHQAGVYHADLTLKNILTDGREVYFIDLDKAKLRPAREDTRDVMNLARLNRSVEKLFGRRGCVTRADRMRFLRRYLEGRARLKELARASARGLWLHRLWWSLSGQA